MTQKLTLPALALTFTAALAAPGFAQVACSAGGPAAYARVLPPSGIAQIQSAQQYAWDGAENYELVCDLLTDSTFTAEWTLFSGEVDAARSGVCVELSLADDGSLFSCATPEDARAAFAAPLEAEGSILIFDSWQEG